jgi:hypothetical protein
MLLAFVEPVPQAAPTDARMRAAQGLPARAACSIGLPRGPKTTKRCLYKRHCANRIFRLNQSRLPNPRSARQ